MPRSRRNDPLGVSDNPICVTDLEREAEVLDEFNRRLSYLAASYRFGKDHFPDYKNFNRSLARLKKAVGRPKVPGRPESRLDPRLEILINHRARKLAADRVRTNRLLDTKCLWPVCKGPEMRGEFPVWAQRLKSH